MALSTRLKRKSAINVGMPFGRLGPVMDGGNLDTAAQRRTIVGYAWGSDLAPPSGGINTRRKRGSAINIGLPFGRTGHLPDGSNLEDQGERRHAVMSYEIVSDFLPPLVGGHITCGTNSQEAQSGCVVSRLSKQVRVKPAPQVTGRTIGFDAVVASAERAGGGRPGPRPFVVYKFGSGRNSKSFVEIV